MKTRVLALAAVAFPFIGLSSAATLVEDHFSGVAPFSGHLPDTVGTTAWVANASYVFTSGTATYGNTLAGMASIDMGSGYFAANPGIYQLSLDVRFASPASGGTTAWGVGFSTTQSTADSNSLASGANGQPWIFLRESGVATVRNNATSGGTSSAANAYPAGSTYTLRIILDTSAAIWTYSASVNGTTLQSTTAFATNPNLRYIGITSTGTPGSGDNFLLTFTPVPEPSAALLSASALVGLCCLRRRGS